MCATGVGCGECERCAGEIVRRAFIWKVDLKQSERLDKKEAKRRLGVRGREVEEFGSNECGGTCGTAWAAEHSGRVSVR